MKKTLFAPGVALVVGLLAGCSTSGEQQLSLSDAVTGGDLESTAVLLEKGADVNHNYPESDGYTLLMMTAARTNDESPIVPFLLSKGADPNLGAPSGRTALQLAAMNNHPAHVSRLISAGADLHAADENGKSAIDHARDAGYEAVVKALGEVGDNAR